MFLGNVAVVRAVRSRSDELIAAQALMGLGAGIVFPLSLAVVSAAFGDDDDRPKAIGILAAAVALGLPLEPVLGGLLLQHFSWHSVFWINVPAVCATLAAGAVLMPESRNPAAPPLDAPGALLSAGGGHHGLVWGVINGQEHRLDGAAHLGCCWPGRRYCSAAFLTPRTPLGKPGHRPGAVPGQAVHLGQRWPPSRSRWRCSGSCSWCPSTCRACSATTRSANRPAAAADNGRAAGRGRGELEARSCAQRAPGSPWPPGWRCWTGGLVMLSQIHLATGYAYVAAGLAVTGLGTGAGVAAAMNAVMAAAGGDEGGVGASVNSAVRQVGGGDRGRRPRRRAVHARLHPCPRPGAGRPRDAAPGGCPPATRPSRARRPSPRPPSSPGTSRQAAPCGPPRASAFLHGMSIMMLICAGVAALAVQTSLRYLPGPRRPPPVQPPAAGATRRRPRTPMRDDDVCDRSPAGLAAAQEGRHA